MRTYRRDTTVQKLKERTTQQGVCQLAVIAPAHGRTAGCPQVLSQLLVLSKCLRGCGNKITGGVSKIKGGPTAGHVFCELTGSLTRFLRHVQASNMGVSSSQAHTTHRRLHRLVVVQQERHGRVSRERWAGGSKHSHCSTLHQHTCRG